MPSHHFDHECPRVRDGRGVDVVEGLAYTVECGGRADGEIGEGHVVVYRPYEPDDLKMTM